MTESKNNNYEIITEKFHDIKIDLMKQEDTFWLTAETIGVGLEYKNPRISIIKLYNSHKDELEEYKGVTDLVTPGGIQKTTIFSELGVYLLIMFSNQPKAKEFRRWVIQVTKKIRKEGYYVEKRSMDRFDMNLRQLEIMKDLIITQKEQQKKLNRIESKVEKLEEKDKYSYVSPQTKKRCRDQVKRVVIEYRLPWQKVWIPKRDKYHFNSYGDMSEDIALKVIQELKNEYPSKNPQKQLF